MEMRLVSDTVSTRVKKFAGELWALGAVFGYSGANLFGRAGVATGNPIAGPLLRAVPSLLMGLLLGWRGKQYRQLLPGDTRYVGSRLLLVFVGSGLISVIGTFAFFFALHIGGVDIAVPVLQTQLIWGSLFAWIMLGERVNARGVLGILVTFAGLVVLALGQSQGVPVSNNWYWGLGLALIPAIAWGFSGVVWRYGQQRGMERSSGITIQYGTAVVASALFLLFSGQLGVYRTIGVGDFTALLVSGVFGGVIAVFCMFTAMKLLPAATVFVLNGLTPLVTALGGGLFLHENVNGLMWLGILLASAGVVLFQLTAAVGQGPPRQATAAPDESEALP
jgi:drug/metabolite transporter (DMT)-like permease